MRQQSVTSKRNFLYFSSVARFRLQLTASGPCWLCFRPSSTRRHLPFQLCPHPTPHPLNCWYLQVRCRAWGVGREGIARWLHSPLSECRWLSIYSSRCCSFSFSHHQAAFVAICYKFYSCCRAMRHQLQQQQHEQQQQGSATTSQLQLPVENKPKLSCWWRTSKNPQIFVLRAFTRFHIFSFLFANILLLFFSAARWQRHHAW